MIIGVNSYVEMDLVLLKNDIVSFKTFCFFFISKFQLIYVNSAAYKPILAEVEKILEEAGLDEEEMRRSAVGGGLPSAGLSRNRR